MKVEAYCACGAALRGTIQTKDKDRVNAVLRTFLESHKDPGCQPCDAKTARNKRRRGK